MKPVNVSFDEESTKVLADFLVLSEYKNIVELVRKAIADHICLVRHIQKGKRILILDEKSGTATYHDPLY